MIIEILEMAVALVLLTGGLVIASKSAQFVFKRGRDDDENGGQEVVIR